RFDAVRELAAAHESSFAESREIRGLATLGRRGRVVALSIRRAFRSGPRRGSSGALARNRIESGRYRPRHDSPPRAARERRAAGDKPVDVDLIVDLGNTRTIALLLEDHGAVAQTADFSARAHAVRFLPRRLSFGSRDARENVDEYSVIDSWVLVHRTGFANL